MASVPQKLPSKQPYLTFKRQFLAANPDIAVEIEYAQGQLREAQAAVRGWDERVAQLHREIERAFVQAGRVRQI